MAASLMGSDYVFPLRLHSGHLNFSSLREARNLGFCVEFPNFQMFLIPGFLICNIINVCFDFVWPVGYQSFS